MYRRFLVLTACLLLAACSGRSKGTWQAYTVNNDKPGVGIEFVRDSNGLHGSFYVFDITDPGDFAHGRSFPMTIKSADDKEVDFVISFFPDQPDKVAVKLDSPLDGPSFHATMTTSDGHADPVELNFKRVK